MQIDITELQFYKDNFESLEINTPDGFQEVGDLYFKPNKKCYRVLFNNGDIVECSEDHLFQSVDESWVKTKDIEENFNMFNNIKVLEKEYIGIRNTYDLEVLHDNHRYYSNDISSHNSGKTLIALSAAMKLMDKNKDKYDKIVYIRKNIISGEDLGYMKGDLNDKMSGFLAPLYSNMEYIVDKKYNGNKKSKLTKEEQEAKLEEMMTRYQISFKYEGHLRGDTIRNAIVIFDEAQNNEISSAKTILTRIGENCKVFILGSTKQIDNPYLNKHNNALTYLVNKIGEDNMNVQVTGINLTKTVRSAIAEWADEF